MNRDVTVQDVMDREYVGVSESDGLVETVELLLRNDVDTAVVQRGSEHVGVLTQEDVLALLVEGPDPEDATVGDAMTESVPTVSPDAALDGAADRMSARESGRLVVTNGSEPLGIVSERDLLATRSLEGPPQGPEEEGLVAGMGGETEAETTENGSSGFEDQSICEGCGTFASDLSSFNGQLLCSDCRAI
jgi:CBS domain-containing protein